MAHPVARVFYRAVFARAGDAEPASVSDHLAAAKFLGERLRELRQRHALTQEQAAALCGMEYKYYQMVEWGRKNVRLDTMARISRAYHLKVWDLVQHGGLPPSRVERIPEVVSAPHRPPRPRGRPRKCGP
jgi:DNA-binding XRE family transcriptional regulator